MIIEFARQLKEYYYDSFLGESLKAIGEKITHGWENSLVGRCFANDKTDEALGQSVTYQVLTAPLRVWGRFASSASDFASNSLVSSCFFRFARMQLQNALTLHSGFYGSMLVAFGFGGILVHFGLGAGLYIRLLLIVLGGLLIWLNTPMITWLKGSLLFRLMESLLGAEIELSTLEGMQGEKSILLGVVNGLLMAAAGLMLPSYLTPAVFIAITGLILLFWRFEVGIFLLIFVAPILPTMVCAGIAFLSFLSYIIRCVVEKRSIMKMNAVSFLIFGFTLLLGFYAITSLSMIKSVEILILYAIFISTYFIIANTIINKKRLYWIVAVFLTSGLFVSLYGIYQQFFGTNEGHAWIDETMFEAIAIRVYSTLENPNVLGEYLLFVIPLAMAMVWACKGVLAKLYYTGIFALSSFCLVFTQSRGCWIGIMVGLFVYIFLINKRYLSLFFIALLVAPFVLPVSIIERFTSIGNVADSSTSYRVFIWLGTFAMLRDFWPFGLGLGPEAFNKIYPFYSYSNIYAPHTHNIYLQWMTETGIVGFGVMIVMLFFFWRKLINVFTRFGKSMPSIIGVAVLAGIIAFMVQGAFDYVWYNYRVFLMFWMVLAIGMAAHHITKAEVDRD